MAGKQELKYIQSLGQKKHRDADGVFIAEGPKLVAELIAEIPELIMHVYALQDWVEAQPQRDFSFPVTVITEAELEKISQLTTPNQVLALLRKPEEKPMVRLKGELVLLLDAIQDPGNLGTIIRIADWFGVSQVVCSRECADCYSPKVVQSTMGSIARVQVHYVDLPAWLQEQPGVKIYAAALGGEDIREVSKPEEGIIVIGNESKGIRPEILEIADVKLTIPRIGQAESLNAAVAAGILMSFITT